MGSFKGSFPPQKHACTDNDHVKFCHVHVIVVTIIKGINVSWYLQPNHMMSNLSFNITKRKKKKKKKEEEERVSSDLRHLSTDRAIYSNMEYSILVIENRPSPPEYVQIPFAPSIIDSHTNPFISLSL
jgi:hypothetical protein